MVFGIFDRVTCEAHHGPRGDPLRPRSIGVLFIIACGLGALSSCSEADLSPIPAGVALAISDVNVGPLPLGFVTAARFRLVNTGARPVSGRVRTATTSGLLIEPLDRSWQVGPDRNVDLRVRLTATAEGPLQGNLRFEPDEPSVAPLTGRVRATGVAEPFERVPANLSFGEVRIGTEAERTFRIINLQADTLEVGLQVPTSDFTIVGPTTRQLRPGQTDVVTVRFRPQRPSDARVRIEIIGDCESDCVQQMTVSGIGATSGLRCPSVVDFGTMNPGGCARETLSCPSILPEGLSVVDWQVDSDTESFTASPSTEVAVGPGGAFSLPLRFCPSTLGVERGTLTLTVQEPRTGTDVVRIDLIGAGGGPDLQTDSAAVSFGGARIGRFTERTLTIRNVGYAPLAISGVSVEGPFALNGDAPFRLEPAEGRTLSLRFAPVAIGATEGALHVESDDPDQARLAVTLLGTGVETAPCAARLQPRSETFGLTNRGSATQRQVVLQATGPEQCEWFEPRIEGRRAFSLAPGTPLAGVVTASQAVTFDIIYAPTEPSPTGGDQADFAVDVPNDSDETLRAHLRGVSVSNDLRVYPTELNYGPLGIDIVRRRTVTLYNVGSVAAQLTEVGLAPGTSTDFSVTASVSVPAALGPGARFTVVVSYAPSAAGRDGGRLSFEVADLPAPIEVPLFGEADDRPCGHLTGEVCTPDGQQPSVGASVTLERPVGQPITVYTDEDGTYDVFCLAPGPATLRLRNGHYTASVSTAVQSGRTTTVPRTCLDPTSPEVAVVTGTHDRVQVILQQVGVPFTEFDGFVGLPRLLTDRDLLLSYDIVMLNCGFDDRGIRLPEVADNLRAFVSAGGSLYVSDFAYDAVESAFSDLIDFAGSDSVQDAGEVGVMTLVQGAVVDPRLLRWMPAASAFDVNLATGYALIDGYGPSTDVHVVGDFGGRPRPLIVSARGPGRVVYTAYHTTAIQVDPAARIPLSFVILGL